MISSKNNENRHNLLLYVSKHNKMYVIYAVSNRIVFVVYCSLFKMRNIATHTGSPWTPDTLQMDKLQNYRTFAIALLKTDRYASQKESNDKIERKKQETISTSDTFLIL